MDQVATSCFSFSVFWMLPGCASDRLIEICTVDSMTLRTGHAFRFATSIKSSGIDERLNKQR